MNRKEIEQSSKEQIELARSVEVLFASKGWQIYQTFLRNKIARIKDKNDYLNIYDFRADRKVIRILKELEAELRDTITDAESASEIISKLNDQTSSDIPIDEETE